MQSTSPHINSISDLATGNGNDVTPFSQQSVVLTKQAYIQLKWEAHYWRAQHTRLLEREAALKAEVETLHATIRDLTQRLYGAKSEKTAGCDGAACATRDPEKPAGGVGVDAGVAGQIPLWPSHLSLL